MKTTNLKRGDQIAYTPTHTEGNLEHPDVEFGFVTSVRDDAAFCRYWSEHHNGLRTTSCSELTPLDCLSLYTSRPEWVIEARLRDLALPAKPKTRGRNKLFKCEEVTDER